MLCLFPLKNTWKEVQIIFLLFFLSLFFFFSFWNITIAPPKNAIARTVLQMLHENFHPVPNFNYQPGNPSHRWDDDPIPVDLLKELISNAVYYFAQEPTVLELGLKCFSFWYHSFIRSDQPVYVIGDLHGNYADLMKFAKFFGLWYLGMFFVF